MFAKLLKYEWKASAGTLGILSLAALGLGVMGTLILRLLVNYGDQILNSDSPVVLAFIALTMMLVAVFLGLVLYSAGAQFMLLFRFYKNKFTDEGYLTFTLPVSSHKIFLSSLLNMLIWTVITFLVVVCVVVLAVLIGTAQEGFINTEIFTDLDIVVRDFCAMYEEVYGSWYLPGMIAQTVIGTVSGIILMMTCVTLGAVVAKKHKILAAFGIYYGVATVVSIITTVITFMLTIVTMEMASTEPVSFQFSGVIEILLQLALGIGGYLLSTYLMQRKLNLP